MNATSKRISLSEAAIFIEACAVGRYETISPPTPQNQVLSCSESVFCWEPSSRVRAETFMSHERAIKKGLSSGCRESAVSSIRCVGLTCQSRAIGLVLVCPVDCPPVRAFASSVEPTTNEPAGMISSLLLYPVVIEYLALTLVGMVADIPSSARARSARRLAWSSRNEIADRL